MSNQSSEEFFIGWQNKPPQGIGRFLRSRTIVILVAILLLGGLLPTLQKTLGVGQFQFGNVREFSGVLVAEPVPMLVMAEPEADSGQSVFLLVRPLKFGFSPDIAKANHLKSITMKGTLIYDEGNAMIEVVDDSISETGNEPSLGIAEVSTLGTQTLRGEIVDSKCYLGVMNPGVLKPHRACAINCIEGGVPPMLLLRGEDGSVSKLIMTGINGEPVNDAVLEHVAEPVEVTGEVRQRGRLLFIAIDPTSGIHRL